MNQETITNDNILYSAKVPKGRSFIDSIIYLLIIIVLIGFTIGIIFQVSQYPKTGSLFGALVLLVIELFVLFFIVDLFAWHAFGQEKISIQSGKLVVENHNRLLTKVRTAALNDITDIEIDDPINMLLTVTTSRLRYMRHRGNIVLHMADGTKLRLCMSPEIKVLQSMVDTIKQAIKNQ